MNARGTMVQCLPAVFLLLGCVQIARSAYIPAKAAAAQLLLDRAFDRAMQGEQRARPWSWADTWVSAKIEIPRLGASTVALESASGQALAFGPGHVLGSAEVGEPGTSVYAAHRDTHFRYLRDVQIGDVIRVTRVGQRTFNYRVTGTRIAPHDASGIEREREGTSTLALVTCYPFEAITHGPERYIVEAALEQ